MEETVAAAVTVAKRAAAGTDALVALDIGPLGELLEPMGTLPFERAYELFRETVLAGVKAGADLIAIETMTDLYETKAALLAAKENSDLPVFVTMSFEASGRTFTGCTVASMARTLEGLGADAIGLNCSLGPDRLAPLLKELCASTRLPVIAKPNAGLPDPVDGRYDMDPEAFAQALLPCVEAGVSIVGGCCGTTPDYIRRLAAALEGRRAGERHYDAVGFVCTPAVPVRLDGVRVIGERGVLERILPIVKKYGAAVVGLTLDKGGIPQTAEGRVAIARRILDAALSFGIPKEDVWIDCPTLTVSAQQEQAAP